MQDQPAALAEVPEFSMYTDLDLLLARLEAQENGGQAQDASEGTPAEAAHGGETYDDFLLLSDVLGQAVPAGASPAELESLTIARVECERRRVTKSGKVKSKLSVVGVRCVDCAICLARFKVDQFAVVLPECLHIFHENCIRSWFRLSRVCPVCRAEVFPPRPPPTVDLLQ
ncbi:RING finger protein 44 [Rhodotorula toruloides]|uniref:RING finger protein 44 n=1 Tax=Rhodotorula toruloides TaxID=5286 RepID=A0A511KB35_RHOTO|nr:RING finger protein 44 [Rhodotorula toruloides]